MPFKRAPNKMYPGNHIATFIVDGKLYEHRIFSSEDDRIECTEVDTGEIILTHTANGYVVDKHGRDVGKWNTDKQNNWQYKKSSTTEILYTFGYDLLKAEVELSKLYISNRIP